MWVAAIDVGVAVNGQMRRNGGDSREAHKDSGVKREHERSHSTQYGSFFRS
jgi:hypothetical protein